MKTVTIVIIGFNLFIRLLKVFIINTQLFYTMCLACFLDPNVKLDFSVAQFSEPEKPAVRINEA